MTENLWRQDGEDRAPRSIEDLAANSMIKNEKLARVLKEEVTTYTAQYATQKEDLASGQRFNEGKPDFTLVSGAIMRGISRGMGHGILKYGRNNYLNGGPKMSYLCIIASLLRHVFALKDGKDYDLNEKGEVDEKHSGLLHIDLMSCNCNMLADLIERGIIVDDRYKEVSGD
jgi:hypothetical protein